MYAVIFRAEIALPDQAYSDNAQRLRRLAMEKYGCRDFVACTEGNTEIAISYWDSEDQIAAWKRDPEHQAAQREGRAKWYSSYTVEVARVERGYSNPVS